MSEQSAFAAVLLLMPDHEAAQALLLLTRAEQLTLLQEIKTISNNFLPAEVAAAGLLSLQPLQQFESKAGGIIMSVAQLAGVRYASDLLNAWTGDDPVLLQSLRKHIFFFEEIICLPDRTVQRALQEIKLSPLLLLDADNRIVQKLLTNVSRRVAKQVTDELQQYGQREEAAAEAQLAKGRFARLIATLLKTEEPAGSEFCLPGIPAPVGGTAAGRT